MKPDGTKSPNGTERSFASTSKTSLRHAASPEAHGHMEDASTVDGGRISVVS